MYVLNATEDYFIIKSTDLPGGRLRRGQRVDIFDEHPSKKCWLEGSIIEERENDVKVNFRVSYSPSS